MKVCLDPGHYEGYNRGYNKSYAEGTAMFNYAYKLGSLLKSHGIDVVYTKKTVDENPALMTRGKKAKGCDLFVSLHSNGVDNPQAYGVSTFYSIKRDNDKTWAQNWCDRLAALINGGTRSRGASTRKGGGDWDYYTVIQGAVSVDCPHVFLIEHGFHSNPEECAWLMQEENMDVMAELECHIICDILNVPFEPTIITIANPDGKVIYAYYGPATTARKLAYVPQCQQVKRTGIKKNGMEKVKFTVEVFGYIADKYLIDEVHD